MNQTCFHLGVDPLGSVSILNAMEPLDKDPLNALVVSNARFGALWILRAAAEGRTLDGMSVDSIVSVFQTANSKTLIGSASTITAAGRPTTDLTRNVQIAVGLIQQANGHERE